MSRSLFKGPLINPLIILNKKKQLKLFNKNLTILPEYVDYTFNVYNGKSFILLAIKDNMVGYKFGEFITTRARYQHKKK